MELLTDKEYAELALRIKKQYGIDMAKKKSLVESRLNNTLTSRGFTSYKSYFDAAFADKSGKEMTLILNKITTNHTSFMREKEHFTFFLDTILPYLERTNKREFRIWCAASSSGEEPYNIAMCIAEYFAGRQKTVDTRILASDLSTDVLSKAQAGIYATESLDTLPAAWKTKYFKKVDDTHSQISEAMKKEVIFRQINLVEPFSFKAPFDVIFCRNVMIYFDSPTKINLIDKFYDITRQGGFLLIGHSENIDKEHTKYNYIKPSIYQK